MQTSTMMIQAVEFSTLKQRGSEQRRREGQACPAPVLRKWGCRLRYNDSSSRQNIAAARLNNKKTAEHIMELSAVTQNSQFQQQNSACFSSPNARGLFRGTSPDLLSYISTPQLQTGRECSPITAAGSVENLLVHVFNVARHQVAHYLSCRAS